MGGRDAAELPVRAKAALFEVGGALQAATVPALSPARLPPGAAARLGFPRFQS